MRKTFGITHRETLGDDGLRQSRRIGRRHQRSRMTGGKRPVCQHIAHRIGELQQSQAICNMTSAFADDFTEIVLGVTMFGNQLFVTHCLFKRIKVGTLHVFDNRQLQGRAIVHITNDDRHIRKTSQLRRAPAPFTGDNLVAVDANRSHHHRLNNSMLTNGCGKILQLILIKMTAWVSLASGNELNRNGAISVDGALRLTHWHRLIHFSDQRRKTTPEPTLGKIITHKILLHTFR
ncbi:hypothetical protein AGR13a_Cc340147 [Agrobacterium genomosp. 13 str. CFBP 6927]|uniref:Uncharacterized protein n=1 Tax=Agrobacterium genomosp. 13 str. CFBP 6927 TaxID=1183428 RepID=A0ABM9VHH0_9HYPH|nr:hypothetical protein AGR13a_Cc340147 [Agrobacterium genomosp. 13 str. CFBP 6927]